MEKRKKLLMWKFFLLRELNAEQRLWDVLVDPARKIHYRKQIILWRR